MRRREFITLLGGAAASWPLAARAQSPERVRRLGVIMAIQDDDPQRESRMAALHRAIQDLGWVEGRNIRIILRAGSGAEVLRKNIAEMIALAPDVILCAGEASLRPMMQANRAIPVLFVNVADPVGGGFVESLAQPGGNITGFLQAEYGLSGKLAELLKQMAPDLRRVAVLRDPALISGIGQFAIVQSVAPSLGLDARPINVRDLAEIERGIAAFARGGHGGLIVHAGATANVNRSRINALAIAHKMPLVSSNRVFTSDGGLASYGPDQIDQYRQVAAYIDRVLKGEKPADLPVQAPTKYELVINLKTAKALGLTVPPSLLARADEVIE